MRRFFPYSSWQGQFLPLIPVYISTVDFSIEALVDSGANISIFHSDIASRLNLKVRKGASLVLTGVGGQIKVYIHRLELEIAGRRFIARVAFSEDFRVNLNILGRTDVFEQFRITFDEIRKQLILTNS